MRGAKEKEEKTEKQVLAGFMLEFYSLSHYPLTRSILPKLSSSKQPHCTVLSMKKTEAQQGQKTAQTQTDRLPTRIKANLQQQQQLKVLNIIHKIFCVLQSKFMYMKSGLVVDPWQ